jgi:sec-independent protein translocase protein TatA
MLSIQHLLVVLAIVALIFGTKRLKDVGGDLGSAIKSFRKAMQQGETEDDASRDQKRLTSEGEGQAEKQEQREQHQK